MKRVFVTASIIMWAFVLIMMNGCANDKYDKLYPSSTVVTCDTTSISYSKDIVPIVVNNCYSPGNGCHDAAGATTSGFNYSSYAGIAPTALNGILVNDINFASGYTPMPKGGNKLSQCDINKFTRWVNEGAPNN